MTSPAQSAVQNLLPVQAYFDAQDNFVTFIGQNKPFYATANPSQSNVNITNSTINSTTIGALVPSTGNFTNISTVTGTISTTPTGGNDIANKNYVDYAIAGASWKPPARAATTTNITLSGAQTIDTVAVVAGDTVLVKNQTNTAENGIYTVQTGSWTYFQGADTWNEYLGAIIYIESGGQATTAWYCTAQPGGTLGVTALQFFNLSFASGYTAGTGLTLLGTQFSITNTGVSAATYGSASNVPVIAFNAQGQATSVTNTAISIPNTQVTGLGTLSTQNASSVAITGGTINGTTIVATTASTGAFTTLGGTTITASTQFSGPGTGLTGTATSLSIGGNAATATTASTATSATTATNLAGGASGSLPYQTGAGATSFLGIGSTGQFLTVVAGAPSWASISASTVSSFSAGTTGLTPASATTGAITLAGTLAVANGGTGVTTSTGSGSVVLSTSPTLVTPILGTPASGTLTNTTGFPAGSLAGTTLASNVVTSSLTSVGTIASGTWNGSIIGLTYGGTNANLTAVAGGAVYSTGSGLAITAAGTAGQILTSNGASAPTWSANSATIAITDDTTTNSTRYPLFSAITTGNINTEYTSSTKFQFNPSTGVLTTSGHTLNGTGGLFAGDFSNATVASRNAFQTSTTNGSTGIYALPNGSSTAASWQATNNATPTNCSKILIATNGSTDVQLVSGINGSGTYLPMTFYNNGAEKARLSVAGGFSIGTTTDPGAGGLQVAGTANFTGSSSVLAAVFANAAETTTISATAATGTINYDVTTQSVIYYTSNASANWTVNFRASSGTSLNTAMATGQSVTVVFLVTQGTTAYYNNAITIDGNSVTPKYQGGTAWSSGNASGIDAYSYTIVKTGSAAFTVFASQTQFK